jgi:hypothetical protein
LTGGRGIGHSQPTKVYHMGDYVNHRPSNDGPAGCYVKSDALVERYDIIQRCPTQKRDEVAANGKHDEGDIDMEDKSGPTCNGWMLKALSAKVNAEKENEEAKKLAVSDAKCRTSGN